MCHEPWNTLYKFMTPFPPAPLCGRMTDLESQSIYLGALQLFYIHLVSIIVPEW